MVKKIQALRAKKGFTLVELIVVIAIIGVLAAILIPTLSGVIESSRKRSAESTCQSLQNLAKTYASTVMSKTGKACTGSESVDMDEDGITSTNLKQYVERQIPELKNDGHLAQIAFHNGNVVKVIYIEGSFKAEWTAASGLKDTEKLSASALTSYTGSGCNIVSAVSADYTTSAT